MSSNSRCCQERSFEPLEQPAETEPEEVKTPFRLVHRGALLLTPRRRPVKWFRVRLPLTRYRRGVVLLTPR